MAIAAMVLWMCTAAAGAYLLATGIRARDAEQPAAGPAAETVPGLAAVAAEPLAAAAPQAGAT
uniref:hypothetical protein n=1 Tax=Trebonia sp. TaxID=2767075 RepID=UPI002623A394